MASDPYIPSGSATVSSEAPRSRPGRAWAILSKATLDPDSERHPAATGLHQLADIELDAYVTARRKNRKARLLAWSGTTLTLLALALAAAAGFGTLSDVIGKVAAAWIALSSAVMSAISAFVQTKSNGDAARLEALMWSRQADDVLDSVVRIVSQVPLPASELRRQAMDAISDARGSEPTRREAAGTPATEAARN